MKNFKYLWFIIFLVGIVLRSFYIFHPIDTASWRECDLAAVADNYYTGGMHFCYPQINWRGNSPGYAEMEFPVYPYLIAVCYKIFGIYEPIGRIISFLFSIGTLLIFTLLTKKLLKPAASLIASSVFAISPLLLYLANTIQSESTMFFFYVASVYFFLSWIEKPSWKNSLLLSLTTALAILTKSTSAHLGILFLLYIIIKKKWDLLYNPKTIVVGAISLIFPVIWYLHAHNFYTTYGLSLGLSNEYHWVGWDFFYNPYFIKGISKQEIFDIWMPTGAVIIIFAAIYTKVLKDIAFKFGLFWLISVGAFYFVAARTTADYWAFYYHVFSIPGVAILLGLSVYYIFQKATVGMPENKFQLSKLFKNKGALFVLSIMGLLIICHIGLYAKTYNNLTGHYTTSEYYLTSQKIKGLIPKNALLLASGGPCMDNSGYPIAYNSSYFFYWFNVNGTNVCRSDETAENIEIYKEKGYNYYILETKHDADRINFAGELAKKYKVLYHDDYIFLFKL